jgi:hypothetical protein
MDLVIVSSAINTCLAPLCYYPIRSIYDKQKRYEQTLQTIESLNKIPNKKVYFVECTDIPEFEDDIKGKVDFYKNVYKGNEAAIDGPYKSIGEAISTLAVEMDDYENIYKISGRYYLNDEFDYSLWDNDDTIMRMNTYGSRLTVFYKINKKQKIQWLALLMALLKNDESRSIEQIMMEIIDFKIIDNIGVEGWTHGGMFFKI